MRRARPWEEVPDETPEEHERRIALYARRVAEGLDVFTGRPLTKRERCEAQRWGRPDALPEPYTVKADEVDAGTNP